MTLLILFILAIVVSAYIAHRLNKPKSPADIHAALIVDTERELIEAHVYREDYSYKVRKLEERLQRLKKEKMIQTFLADASVNADESHVVHFISAGVRR